MALVVSILADDFDVLARRALRAAPTADVIELRLDHLENVSERALSALFASLGRPAIVAVNGPEAYGKFQGSRAERRSILERAVRAGAAFIDIDWRQARELPDLPKATRRIVSRHERTRAGPARDLERELRAHTREGDWLKLVVEAESAADGLEVLSLLDGAPGDLIAFASGAAGSFTRILAPILGSPWTYAAPDPDAGLAPSQTAPGQLAAAQLRGAWPAGGARASTRIFAVLGKPIAHSISPRVHTRALRTAGVDCVFVSMEVDDLARTLAGCVAENWCGFAVTAPLKQAAFVAASRHDASSRRARASNTLVRTKNGWSAFNTDVDGVRGALEHAAQGGTLAGRRALVLGAGGAARAALVALEDLGAQCTISARDFRRAQDLALEFGASALAWEERAANARGFFEIIVQCTPAGAAGAQSLLADDAIAPEALVVDALYRPLETPLIAAARRRGARTARGADWFIFQAERQFELLTGRPAPKGVIREEVLLALA